MDIWKELAELITKDMLNPKKCFPEHRKNLEQEIEKIIKEYVDKRIVMCYITVGEKNEKI